MPTKGALTARIEGLIAEVEVLLRDEPGANAETSAYDARCVGMVRQAVHAIEIVCPPQTAYRMDAATIKSKITTRSFYEPASTYVREMGELLTRLLDDLQSGLLSGVEIRAIVETFGDFLDHATAYLDDGRKDPAGVIAGVVFEDAIRRLGQLHNIQNKDVEQIINGLKAIQVLTKAAAQRAKAAAAVRTHSTHAEWEKFSKDDVIATMSTVRELIDQHLSHVASPLRVL
jgi:hypothetical protein